MPKLYSNVPKYVPTDEHIRNVLLFFFRMKKDATEAHAAIKEAYGEEHAVSQIICDYWYKRFENGDVSLEE